MNAMEDNIHDPVGYLPAAAGGVVVVSKQDPNVSHVMDYFVCGQPSLFDGILKPYYRFRIELTIEADSLVHKTNIPNVLQCLLLKELNSVHTGISRMKPVASCFFWWPNLDTNIESISSRCTQYQELSRCPVPGS